MTCEQCGFTNSAYSSACANCGAPLAAATRPQPAASVTIDLAKRVELTDKNEKLYETRKFIIVSAALGAIVVLGLIILTITSL